MDARMLGPRLHGVGRHVWSIATHVARLAPHDDISMLGRSPWAEQLARDAGNVRVEDVPARPFSVSEQWQLPLALVRLRPQLFHATSAAIPLLRPVPYVMTIADLIPLLFQSDRLRYRLYFRHWLPWAARRARRVLTVSEATRDDLCRYLGLPEQHIEVIPNGVDAAFSPHAAEGEAERLEARYGVRRPYLLTAGNPKAYKNLPRALELLDALDFDADAVVLSARGPLLDAAISRFSKPSRLRHVTYVEEEDLPALYRQAHVFFYASLYEGFGLPVLEAMACGCAVVTSAAASLREVASSGAILVDVGDREETLSALQAACTDSALRARLQRDALAQAARFTWEDCARRTLAVYHASI